MVKNLAAHLSDVAGGYFLNLLLAGRQEVTDADAAIFRAEGAAHVAVLLEAGHHAGEARGESICGDGQFGHGQREVV